MTEWMNVAEFVGSAAGTVLLHGLIVGTIVPAAVLVGRRLLRSSPRRLTVWLWLSLLLLGISPMLPGMELPIAIPLPSYTAAETAENIAFTDTAPVILETPVTDGTVWAEMPSGTDAAEITVQRQLSAQGIMGLIWMAGMAVVLGMYAVDAVHVRRLCRHADFAEQQGSVRIYTIDGLRSPFVRGILCPRIYIPAAADGNAPAKKWIMEHECAHIRRGDSMWRLLWQIGLCVYWFQPLLWYAYRAFVADTEGACDETVLMRCGDSKENRADYAQTLLVYSAKTASGRQVPIGLGVSEMHGRITAILHPAAAHRTGWVVLAAVMIISAGAALLTPTLIGSDAAISSDIQENSNTVSIGIEPSSEMFGFAPGYVESHPEIWSSSVIHFDLPDDWNVIIENPDSLHGNIYDETGTPRGTMTLQAFSPIDGEGIPPENVPPAEKKWQAIYSDMRLSMMQSIADDDYRPIVTRERSESAVAYMDQAICEEGVPAAAWEHQRVSLVLAYDQDCSLYARFTFDARTDAETMEKIAASVIFEKTE